MQTSKKFDAYEEEMWSSTVYKLLRIGQVRFYERYINCHYDETFQYKPEGARNRFVQDCRDQWFYYDILSDSEKDLMIHEDNESILSQVAGHTAVEQIEMNSSNDTVIPSNSGRKQVNQYNVEIKNTTESAISKKRKHDETKEYRRTKKQSNSRTNTVAGISKVDADGFPTCSQGPERSDNSNRDNEDDDNKLYDKEGIRTQKHSNSTTSTVSGINKVDVDGFPTCSQGPARLDNSNRDNKEDAKEKRTEQRNNLRTNTVSGINDVNEDDFPRCSQGPARSYSNKRSIEEETTTTVTQEENGRQKLIMTVKKKEEIVIT